MNTKGNVLTVVTAAMLVVSATAGAQILGGAVNGALGGSFGMPGMQGSGAAAGNGSFGAGDVLGGTRDRVSQAEGRARNAAGNTTSATRSRVETAGGATSATAETAHSASVNAGRQAAHTAQQAGDAPASGDTPATTPSAGGLLLGGSGSAGAEKHAMGRTITADGAADSTLGADRNGVQNSSSGKANVSAKKEEPVTAPAQ